MTSANENTRLAGKRVPPESLGEVNQIRCCSSFSYTSVVTTEGISGHRQRYDEIDVSHWTEHGPEPQGSKPKQWLIDPVTGEDWLMKKSTFNTPRDEPEYRKGDDWAERIACGVSRVLGLPAAEVELSVSFRGEERVYGTICRSVLGDKSESLIHGNELLAEQGDDVTDHHRESYTVEAVHKALRACQPPTDTSDDLSTWDVFVGYLVLDALIGNTDRHEENWAVIQSEPDLYLAPTFDHASSLGFLLSDCAREERLSTRDQNFTPEGFADRAKSRFYCRPHPIDVVAAARMLDGRAAEEHWLNQPEGIDDLVAPIWAIPEHRMSEPARHFAERVMRRNWARLTSRSRSLR